MIVDLLRGAGVRSLVDVRRFPGSRRNPHVSTEALSGWLPHAGITYRWEPRLGGRRRVAPGAARVDGDEPRDTWWRVEQFQAYAAHTRTEEFIAALATLLDEAARVETVVLCSETVWWRCHRRLIADVAVLLHGRRVLHLGHDGRPTPHLPAAGARVTPEGVVYDLPVEE